MSDNPSTRVSYQLPDGRRQTVIASGNERIRAEKLAILLDEWADNLEQENNGER